MTIGIAVICDGGSTILLACDRRASCSGPTPIASDSCGKMFAPIAGKFFAVIAGSVNSCQMFEGYLAERLKRFDGSLPGQDESKVEMQEARTQLVTVLADESLRRELGISFNRFVSDETLSPKTHRQARKIVSETSPEIEVIAAGFADQGGVILAFSGKGEIQETTTPGYHVIGSGAGLAHYWFALRRQRVHMTAARSYWHLREAMQFAAMDPSVSVDNECIAIRKSGVFPLEKAQDYVSKLANGFYIHRTDSLDESGELGKFKEAFSIGSTWD
jgi:hypothetical protein